MAYSSRGDFDIDPKYYGENIQSDKIQTIKDRTKFEFKILEKYFPLINLFWEYVEVANF